MIDKAETRQNEKREMIDYFFMLCRWIVIQID